MDTDRNIKIQSLSFFSTVTAVFVPHRKFETTMRTELLDGWFDPAAVTPLNSGHRLFFSIFLESVKLCTYWNVSFCCLIVEFPQTVRTFNGAILACSGHDIFVLPHQIYECCCFISILSSYRLNFAVSWQRWNMSFQEQVRFSLNYLALAWHRTFLEFYG